MYLGGQSAKFAKFLYDKAGIEIEIRKTNILACIKDFNHLRMYNAHRFRNDGNDGGDGSDILSDLQTLLDAFNVLSKHTLLNPLYDAYPSENVYNGKDLVFYNMKHNGAAIFIQASEMPEFTDSVLTCADWSIVAKYEPSDIEHLSDSLRNFLHSKSFENTIELKDKLGAFRKLYLD